MVSALALNGQVRAIACRTTHLCQEAQDIHQMSPTAAVALGRLMTGTLLLTELSLKMRLTASTTIVRGTVRLQGMTVVGTGHQTVRGYCNQPVVETLHKRPGNSTSARPRGGDPDRYQGPRPQGTLHGQSRTGFR